MLAPTDPVEAEAVGARHITVAWRDSDWLIPTDIDDWPLPLVGDSIGVTGENRLVVNYPVLLQSLQLVLGKQWDRFARVASKRRDLVEMSNVLAAGAGVPKDSRQPMDLVFGGIPRLLFDLRTWPAAVEATLRSEGLDYRDRYRRDDAGARRLTLRQIHVCLTHSPYNSPIVVARNGGRLPLSDAALAVMDLFEAITGRTHPERLSTLPPDVADQRKAAQEEDRKAAATAEYRARRKTPAGRRQTALEIAQRNAQKL